MMKCAAATTYSDGATFAAKFGLGRQRDQNCMKNEEPEEDPLSKLSGVGSEEAEHDMCVGKENQDLLNGNWPAMEEEHKPAAADHPPEEFDLRE
ncbi:hypothetical protein Tco_0442240, partial [Tanacetum coccineum]